MENQLRTSDYGRLWYQEPGVIDDDKLFYGVFEGGGGKGVAYSGALLAMRDRKSWFTAVAGASAGAITAALIAAGLNPDEIRQETNRGLASVRTGVWQGLGRMNQVTGYFSSELLFRWLGDIFQTQIEKVSGTRPKSKVTFEELYKATKIELNVVGCGPLAPTTDRFQQMGNTEVCSC